MDFTTAVEHYEKQLIEEALRSSKNLREAGKLLNINASTVSRKIKQYNIDYPSRKIKNMGHIDSVIDHMVHIFHF